MLNISNQVLFCWEEKSLRHFPLSCFVFLPRKWLTDVVKFRQLTAWSQLREECASVLSVWLLTIPLLSEWINVISKARKQQKQWDCYIISYIYIYIYFISFLDILWKVLRIVNSARSIYNWHGSFFLFMFPLMTVL